MPFRKSELRYAHSDGHCDVTFDGDGQMITGGAEGDVRIWKEEDGDLDAESHRVGDRVLSLAVVKDKLFTAIENNTVQIHTLPDCEPDGLLTRFTAQVNHVTVSGDKKWLAVGASDFNVKAISIDQSKHKSFTGHSAPILSVALNHNAEFCASSSCDGTVKVWKVSEEKCVHTIEDVLKKCSDVSLAKTLCRLTFHEKNLMVPVGNQVHHYNMDWMKIRSFDCETDVSIASISHCAKYMAASTVDGTIRVWQLETKKMILDEKHENSLKITALRWHPKKHQLTYCDSSGHFGQFDDVISAGEDMADEGLSAEQYANLFDSDDDDDFTAIHEKAAEKAKGGDDDDKESAMDEGDINEVLAEMSDGDDDEAPPPRPDPASDDDEASVASEPVKKAAPPLIHDCYKPTPLQRPFQSRSSPQHLAQRFMVWNHVGIVRQYRSEDENTIDVEFHDSAVHHRMTVVNDVEHEMADMSSEAVVLANDDQLVCMHFSTWDSAKEWNISMPKGETITALAIGQGFIAVSTDKRQIRIFSIGGLQKNVFSVAGPVLTLAAYLDKLAIVYHSGSGVPGDQCLSMKMVNMATKQSTETRLPLSPKTTLNYVGFSDEGSLFAMDSNGILRMLNLRFASSWVQVCHTGEHAKGKTDTYWIVGISESQYNIRCILCKGCTYPPVLPRPTIGLLPWKIPLCSEEKSMIEDNYAKSQLSLNFLDEIENEDLKKANDLAEREALMKLFALSCKQGHEYRALEICHLMPDYQTVQLAIKYASRLQLITLAEKLNDLAREKMDEELEKMAKDDDENEDIENTNPEPEPEIQGPMLVIRKEPKSLLSSQNEERKNPFRANKEKSAAGKGSSVFDDIVKEQKQSHSKQSPFGRAAVEIKRAPVKKTTKQKDFFTKPKVSAFDLWYQEESSDIVEEHPDASEEERAKIGVQRFRELTREEKQVWQEKAKSGEKRKRENSGDSESKKVCA